MSAGRSEERRPAGAGRAIAAGLSNGALTHTAARLAAASSALGLRPGEGGRTATLFAHLFLASAVFILGRTVRDTLFLSRYSLAALPWMFVLYGVASAITAVIYGRFADRLPRHVSIAGTVAIGATSYLGVWALVRQGGSWVYPAFYVWSEVVANLLLVQFWTLANDLHDARSAKRLFPVIGSARVLGVVVVGASTGAIVRTIGTVQLLFVLAAMMLVIAALGASLRKATRAEAGPSPRGAQGSVLSDGYVRALALFILLAFTALTVGDYQFKAIARATYREDALAQFFSLFYAGTGVVSFVFQLFVTPRLLARLGVGWGISVMPIVFGAASFVLPFWPALGVATTMKFADNGFQYTIHETSLQALYVPFAASVKARTRALLDVAVKPLSYGLGGVVLALLASRLPVERLSLVTSALVVAWLAIVPLVKRRYLAKLQATLSARGAEAFRSEPLIDAAGREALSAMLASEDPRQVLLALDHLDDDDAAAEPEQVVRLLSSHDPRVRAAALKRLSLHDRATEARVRALLDDPTLEVRVAAVTALSTMVRDDAVPALEALLDAPEREARVAATAGLLARGGVEGEISGGARLSALLSSTSRDDRVEAALVLGALGPSAYRPIRRLLGDADHVVRRAALRASAGVADERLVPDLVALLDDRQVRVRAGAALVAVGVAAVPALLARLADPLAPRDVRLHVPRLLRALPSEQTYRGLLALAREEDSHLRLRIFATLSRVREELGRAPEPLSVVAALVEREVAQEFRKLAGWERARATYSTPLLDEELRFRGARAVRRVLRILELRLDPEPLRLVRDRLDDPRRRANALEVLDSVLDARLRPLVMLFVDDAPDATRIAAAGALVPPAPTPDELILEECRHPNPFVALLALDALTRADGPLVADVVAELVRSPDPLVQEGVVRAIEATRPPDAVEWLTTLAGVDDAQVSLHAHAALAALDGHPQERHMHSTLEKILFLKTTALFGSVPSEDLAPLARVATVERFPSGAAIVAEGEVGDRLYVLIAGKVGVTVGGERVATLGPGEAVGEMAVLDAAPRSASVVADDETTALCIGSEEFYEILHEQVEIAEGVIRMLTRRLRDASATAPGAPRSRVSVA